MPEEAKFKIIITSVEDPSVIFEEEVDLVIFTVNIGKDIENDHDIGINMYQESLPISFDPV